LHLLQANRVQAHRGDSTTSRGSSPRLAPVAAILAFLLAGAAYTESVPPWETPDEPAHLAYVEILAEGRLPTPVETYEYHQPPLYYAWPALAYAATGGAPLPRGPVNPRYPFAAAAYLHPPGEPVVAPLRLMRTFGGLLGALVIALAWATARAIALAARASGRSEGAWQDVHGTEGSRWTDAARWTDPAKSTDAARWTDPAGLAAFCVALLPQFVFISHAISNDVLAAACGALITYGLARWVLPPAFADRGALARPLLCMIVGLALGLITKLNVLPLALAVPVALVLRALADAQGGIPPRAAARRAVLAAGVLVGMVVTVAIALRLALPTVAASLAAAAATRGLGARPELSDPRFMAEQTVLMIGSLWARFGWLSVLAPYWSYAVFGLALLAGAVGMVAAWRGGSLRARQAYAVLGLCALSVFAAAVRSLMADPQPQGRLLFPALAAIAVLTAAGWAALLGARWRRAWSAAVVAGLVATNLWVTAVLLPGTYRDARIPLPTIDTRLAVPQPPSTLRLNTAAMARQTFRVNRPGFRRIEFAVARAEPRGEARLTASVRDDSGMELGSTSVLLAEIEPGAWVGVDIPPQADSAGRTYALDLDVSGANDDDSGSLWLWRMPDGDGYPEGMLTVDGAPATDLVFVTLLAEP
jgi:hypothetical protein